MSGTMRGPLLLSLLQCVILLRSVLSVAGNGNEYTKYTSIVIRATFIWDQREYVTQLNFAEKTTPIQ